MVMYICDKCYKVFYNKTIHNRHINRKFSCELKNKTIDDISRNDISIEDNISIEDEISINDISTEDSKSNDNKFICKDCNKIFSRKFTLERHINLNRCKLKHINLELKISELESKIEKLLNDRIINSNNANIANIANNNNRITNNNNNITNNNTTNNNNITNNIIIKFGHEYKSKGLTNKEIIRIINKGCSSLCESIKLTHFNSRLPELQNIYIPDRNFKNICTFNGKLFELNKLDNVLYSLIDYHISNLKKYINMDLEYEENKLNIVKDLLDKIDDIYTNSKFNKFKNDDYISEILYYLYNNRKSIIQNYKEYQNYKKYLNNSI